MASDMIMVPLLMIMVLCFCNPSHAQGDVKALRAHMTRLHSISATPTAQEQIRNTVDRSLARMKKMEKSITSAVKRRKLYSASAPAEEIEAPVTVGSGEYLMTLSIGTPPKKIMAIVDTGSDLIWTQCQPCINCVPQPDPIFDPSNSTTYSKIPCRTSLCSALPSATCAPDCQYLYQYGDGSRTSGVLCSETLTMSDTRGGEQSIPRIAFGCSHDSRGQGFSQADGLVGLGRGELSLISQLGSTVESKFSYRLLPLDASPSESSPLFFGNAASLETGGKSTPMLKNSAAPELNTYYYLGLEGISVGNSLANIPNGTFDIKADGTDGFFIDSGTTITFLPHAAFSAVSELLDSAIGLPRGACDYGLSLCYQLPSDPSNVTTPDMTFHFAGGADYVVNGEYNFLADTNLLYLLMMDMGDNAGIPAIFGNFQQQNYHIVYDNANQMFSFNPADCSSL